MVVPNSTCSRIVNTVYMCWCTATGAINVSGLKMQLLHITIHSQQAEPALAQLVASVVQPTEEQGAC